MIASTMSRNPHSIGMWQIDQEKALITSWNDLIADLCRRASVMNPTHLGYPMAGM